MKYYKIYQNLATDREYEYAKEYESIEQAEIVVSEYEADDREQKEYHSYTILDEAGNDIDELEQEAFRELAMSAMQDIGLTQDEAEREFEDYQFSI
jgi:nucleosome binding factor SPN SPT16 subunit